MSSGGTALDAVEKTINIMEDNPLFNAGKGAVFTHDGKNELDAAIMDGSNLAAGSVAGVTDIKNPDNCCQICNDKITTCNAYRCRSISICKGTGT